MIVYQLWSASIILLFSSKDYTPIKLYKKFQQQQQSVTWTEIHTVTADVQAYCTLSLHDHIMRPCGSRSKSEHLQLAEPNCRIFSFDQLLFRADVYAKGTTYRANQQFRNRQNRALTTHAFNLNRHIRHSVKHGIVPCNEQVAEVTCSSSGF